MTKIRYAKFKSNQLHLRVQTKTSLHGRETVTRWSEKEGWATKDQCKTTEVNGFYSAECYHLTDFTLLIDGSETDPSLCNAGLSIFGIVINVSSMISLIMLGFIQFINL